MRRNNTVSKDLSLLSAKYAAEENYWLDRLSGELTRSYIPYDSETAAPVEHTPVPMSPVEFPFPGEIGSRLLKLSNGVDYTMHMIVVAAVMVLLHEYTGNRDIIIGVPIYKQEGDEEYINTALTIRSPIDSNMSFKELLLQVRQTIIKAEEMQNYPIEILQSRMQAAADTAGGAGFALFDTAVLMDNIHETDYLGHIPLNMIFSFRREDEKILGKIEYNPALYRVDTIERLVDRFIKLQSNCLFNVDLPIGDIEMVTEEEKNRLLFDFNDTGQEYDREKTIVQLFEEQVEKNPDRIAVEYKNSRVTYRELNRRAAGLGRLLRRKGVERDRIAAIIGERSIDMIVDILAVLKAGGAYLPIDADTPKIRLTSMLADARPSVVLAKNLGLEANVFTGLQGLRSAPVKPFITPSRPPIRDLDRLIPDRTLVNYGKYNRYIGQCMARNAIVIQASRGCPYHCAYCHKIWPKKQVFRSPESILSEVKENVDAGISKFAFVDDIFNLDRKNSTRFFELIIREGLKVQFFFPNGLRGDLLKKDYIDLMVEAGTVSLALALETGSPRLQKVLGKNLNLDRFRENIEYFCSAHPQVILELFTMHGFPGETEEEALMTLDFVKSIRWLHFPYMNVLKIYPNTDMERIALEHGISREAIMRSEDYAHYELSDISPFDRNFSYRYRSSFLHDYFLLKERLLHVLPYQVKVLSQPELLQKYNSYLPTETGIHTFEHLLEHLKITKEELGIGNGPPEFAKEESPAVYQANLDRKKKENYKEAEPGALKVLLLDLSQFFSTESRFFYDVSGVAPLGLMYLLTYLNEQLGTGINGKIAKSRVDFDSYDELKTLLAGFRPDVIGVRSLNIYKDFLHKIVSLLRQWGFTGPIAAGGPYATSDTVTILQDKKIDLVVLSEGEATFLEVIERIIENKGKLPGQEVLKSINGIAFIEEAKRNRAGCREVVLTDELREEQSRCSHGKGERVAAEAGQDSYLDRVERPGDPAYVIYTSGSTGEPKGAMIRHINVHNLVLGLRKSVYGDSQPGLKVAQVAPYFFDASVKQVFGALLQGHCLSIVPDEVRGDGQLLSDYYRDYAVDVSDCTPTHLWLLLESCREKKFPFRIKRFIVGGEPLSRKIAEDFLNNFDGNAPEITNIYGVTECTVDSTFFNITRSMVPAYDTMPIGKPLANTGIYILNPGGKPQPAGVAGELCIAGHGVGRGYLNRPELTAEKFASGGPLFEKSGAKTFQEGPTGHLGAAHQLNNQPKQKFCSNFFKSLAPGRATGGKLYKTGDLARWLPGGIIEFRGRLDHQVKIRGYRLELGEIENNLLKCPEVGKAVVIARTDKWGDQFLCAYVVTPTEESGEQETPHDEYSNAGGSGAVSSAAAIREYLGRVLPDYMIPTYIIPIPSIPFTPNGKVDRRALPEPETGTTGAAYLAPRSAVEKKLVEIWAGVLKVEEEKIGIETDFFELGGHSLRATILISRIHKAFDTRVPLQKIFEKPTIKGISSYIENSAKDRFSNIRLTEKKEYYPLSSAQGRLYLVQQMDEDIASYTTSMIVILTGKLDFNRWKTSFEEMFARHESLRTGFRVVNGETVQEIADRVPFVPEEYSMEEEQGITFARQDFSRPFDLSHPPLLRAGIIKTGADRYIMVVNIHHIIADGTSVGMLMAEFMRLYEGGSPPVLRLRYRDYSTWQKSSEQQELIKKQEDFWLKQFETEPPKLNLPTDFQRPAVRSFAGGSKLFGIGSEETGKIGQLIAREEVTMYMFFLTVFNVFLFKITGQEDILVGTPVANRRHTDLESIAGMFANILVMRSFPERDRSFLSFLREVKQRTLAAFDNQDYKLEELVNRVMKEKDLSRHALFDVLFSLQNMEHQTVRFSDLQMRHLDYNLDSSRSDLVFVTFENENNSNIDILVEYSTALFKEETIESFIANFKEVLAAVLENPGMLLQDIEISSPQVGYADGAAEKVKELDLGF